MYRPHGRAKGAATGAAIAIILALGLTLAFLGVRKTTNDGMQLAAETSQPCMDHETKDRIRTLMLEGVDQALKTHTVNLFETWMKDSAAQPSRAARGMQQGISAYMRSRNSIMNWQPACVM